MLKSQYDLNHPGIVSAIDDVPLWSAPFGLKLLDVVQLHRNIRALDIGSGLGFPLLELSQRLGPTCEVYGIDPWRAAVLRARQKILVWELSHVTIVEGKAESLPFDDRHFDLVVSNNGTNNVDDERRTFEEIRRVARPDAQIVLTMNLPDTMKEFYEVYRQVLQASGKHAEIEKLAAHIHEKRKPLSHTQALIHSVGLDVLRVDEATFSLRYADGSAMLSSSLIQLGFLEPWKSILDPEDRGPIFEALETELNRLAASQGELCLTVPWACFDLRRPER